MIGHKEWRKTAKSPQDSHKIYISEDYATGAAIHECTGQAVAVAFTTTNLNAVGKILRNKFPKASITFFVNSGAAIATILQKAWAAAQAVNALVIVDDVDRYKSRTGDLTPSILFLDDSHLVKQEKKIKKNQSTAADGGDGLDALGGEALEAPDKE